MKAIHTLVKACNNDKEFTQIVKECVSLRELNSYLCNMDEQARLSQTSNQTIAQKQAMNMVQMETDRIVTELRNKIWDIVHNTNLEDETLLRYATKLKSILSDDVDIADLSEPQSIKASKIYLVAKILAENAKYSLGQQKTL